MTISQYHVEKCNALGRAIPKLRKKVTGPSGPRAESPEWEEAYAISEVVFTEWHRLRREIAAACEPWFGQEAFPALPLCPKCKAEDSMEHHRVRFPDAPLDADWDVCSVCGYATDPE